MSKKVFKISKTASITVALTSGLIALGNIGLLAYRDNLTELMLTTNTVSVTTLMVFIYAILAALGIVSMYFFGIVLKLQEVNEVK